MVVVAQNFIMLRDIKEQLNRVHRVCRCKGKEHPKCKEEFQILDVFIEQYGKQLTELREKLNNHQQNP
jgi:hypothetical protein